MKRINLLGALSLVAALALATVSSAAQAHHKAARHHKYNAYQAREVALKKYPGKVIGKVALENEDGKWQYSVNIRSKKVLREVMVGADSGRVESVEITSPAEEAREAAQEAKKHKSGG